MPEMSEAQIVTTRVPGNYECAEVSIIVSREVVYFKICYARECKTVPVETEEARRLLEMALEAIEHSR